MSRLADTKTIATYAARFTKVEFMPSLTADTTAPAAIDDNLSRLLRRASNESVSASLSYIPSSCAMVPKTES